MGVLTPIYGSSDTNLSTIFMVNYNDLKEKVFYWDGSWRYIYVLNTNIQDWENLYSHFVKNYSIKFTVDGEPVALLPKTAKKIFNLKENQTPCLCVQVGYIDVCIHFFVEDDFEADIDPRQIKNQEDVIKVLDFIRNIGALLNKSVIMTCENAQSEVLLTYNHLKKDFS